MDFVVSGAILSNYLNSQLAGLPFISEGSIKSLTSSAYSLGQLHLTPEQEDIVLNAYMGGMHYIFVFYAACTGVNFLLSVGVGNTSLKRPKSDGPAPDPGETSERVEVREGAATLPPEQPASESAVKASK